MTHYAVPHSTREEGNWTLFVAEIDRGSKRTVKRFIRDTSHKKNWTGKKTKNSGAQWERFKTAEITV